MSRRPKDPYPLDRSLHHRPTARESVHPLEVSALPGIARRGENLPADPQRPDHAAPLHRTRWLHPWRRSPRPWPNVRTRRTLHHPCPVIRGYGPGAAPCTRRHITGAAEICPPSPTAARPQRPPVLPCCGRTDKAADRPRSTTPQPHRRRARPDSTVVVRKFGPRDPDTARHAPRNPDWSTTSGRRSLHRPHAGTPPTRDADRVRKLPPAAICAEVPPLLKSAASLDLPPLPLL
ncbi:Uncharacterised protein [Mycobacteroides abscessus subsp. abscessus]|nr:Uncharacterised protein [Mycobacteroides abscessus subsp. abscessus]